MICYEERNRMASAERIQDAIHFPVNYGIKTKKLKIALTYYYLEKKGSIHG